STRPKTSRGRTDRWPSVPAMTAERLRARVFGEVAEDYDRFRPDYPDELVDDVIAYVGFPSECDVAALEVGAGTGKATVAFAARGLGITAIEPDAAMAAVLRTRLAGAPAVTVRETTFEGYQPERRFNLLLSATAWHWTDPATRWERAAAALVPGGALALMWHHTRVADPVLDAGIAEAHRELVPTVDWWTHPVTDADMAATWPHGELADRDEFGDLAVRTYRWPWTLPTSDFVSLLTTHSAYLMLAESDRMAILDAVTDLAGAT